VPPGTVESDRRSAATSPSDTPAGSRRGRRAAPGPGIPARTPQRGSRERPPTTVTGRCAARSRNAASRAANPPAGAARSSRRSCREDSFEDPPVRRPPRQQDHRRIAASANYEELVTRHRGLHDGGDLPVGVRGGQGEAQARRPLGTVAGAPQREEPLAASDFERETARALSPTTTGTICSLRRRSTPSREALPETRRPGAGAPPARLPTGKAGGRRGRRRSPGRERCGIDEAAGRVDQGVDHRPRRREIRPNPPSALLNVPITRSTCPASPRPRRTRAPAPEHAVRGLRRPSAGNGAGGRRRGARRGGAVPVHAEDALRHHQRPLERPACFASIRSRCSGSLCRKRRSFARERSARPAGWRGRAGRRKRRPGAEQGGTIPCSPGSRVEDQGRLASLEHRTPSSSSWWIARSRSSGGTPRTRRRSGRAPPSPPRPARVDDSRGNRWRRSRRIPAVPHREGGRAADDGTSRRSSCRRSRSSRNRFHPSTAGYSPGISGEEYRSNIRW